MNKKLNTVYFLIGATILNLLLLIVLAVVLGLIVSFLFRNLELESRAISLIGVLVILFGSIGGTFFLYSRIIKWAVRKWNLEKYIEPVFGSRRRN